MNSWVRNRVRPWLRLTTIDREVRCLSRCTRMMVLRETTSPIRLELENVPSGAKTARPGRKREPSQRSRQVAEWSALSHERSRLSSDTVLRAQGETADPGMRRILGTGGPWASDGFVPVHCYTSRRFPPIVVPREPSDDESPDEAQLYEVRIIDNDYNTYQEVMDIVMFALDMPNEQAFAVAWEVDNRGSCVVAHAPYDQAEAIAAIIRVIGIEVQVNPISSDST